MEPCLEIQVFGGVEVRRPDGEIVASWVRPTGRRLLCLIALSPARRIGREQAAQLLFPAAGGRRPNALAKALHWCRAALGDPWQEQLVSESGMLRWSGPIRTDADLLLALARGGAAPSERAVLTAAATEERTLLPGWDEQWVDDLRQEVRAGGQVARRALAEQLADGDTADQVEAVTVWGQLARDDPLNQEWQLGMLKALFGAGRDLEARQAMLSYRQVLWSELRVLPGPALEEYWQAASAGCTREVSSAAGTTAPRLSGAGMGRATEFTALTGRNDELARLAQAVDGAESGNGGSAVLVGAPGSGKSALLQVTAERWRSRGFAVACAAAPIGGGPPHCVVVALLGGVLGSAEMVHVQRILRGRADTAVSPTRQERSGAGTVTEVLRALDKAVSIPTLLVVDDLHQADPASARLVAALARLAPGRLFSLVVSTRPTDRQPPPGTLIALGPLPGPAVRDIVRTRYPEASEEQVAVASERSEGNPLFALELAGMLRVSSEERPIPPSAVELLKSRLALLPPAQRLLMPIAVAAGEAATWPVVADVFHRLVGDPGGDPGVAREAVSILVTEDLLTERGGVLRPTHPLIGEAALALLARSRRAAMHDAVADSLSALGLDRESAAHHRLTAFELVPEADRAHAAAESALDAARVALAQGRDADAASMARYVERAWAAAAEAEREELGAQRSEAHLILGHALAGTAPAESHSAYEIGRRTARDDDTRGRFLVAQGWMHYMRGEFALAARSYSEGLELGDLGWRTRASLLTHLGWVLARQGLLEHGLELCEQAVSLTRGRDDPLTEGTALDRTAMILAFQGRTVEAREEADHAFEVASAAGDTALLAAVQSHRGNIRGRLEEWELALRHLDEAVELARSINDPYLESVAWWSRTDVLTRKGDLDAAVAANDEEARCLHLTGNQVHIAACVRRRRRLLGDEDRMNPETSGQTP